MTRYLLDTDIIGNVVEPQPSELLLAWMSTRRDEDLFIASLTLAEILRGVLEKPPVRKRDARDTRFSGPEGPQARTASCRSTTRRPRSERGGSEGRAAGKPRSGLDMIIAAVASANPRVVVTDNEKDFAGLQIVDPARGRFDGTQRLVR